MTVSLDTLDKAIVDHITAAVSWPVGYADVPDAAGWQGQPGASPFAPYLIVDPDPANYEATLASAHQFTNGEWRIRAVSVVPGPVREMADQIRTAMLDSPIVVAGTAVIDVRTVESAGPRRDDQVVPTLFYALEVFAIQATSQGA